MSLAVEKSPAFQSDVTNQFTWYFEKAGDQLAWRFINAVDLTLLKLAGQPNIGTIRRYKNPILQGLRSHHAERPFDKFLLLSCDGNDGSSDTPHARRSRPAATVG